MPDAVEVAVEAALLSSAVEFAASVSLTIALPNIAFVPPDVTETAQYLRATFMPVPSVALGVSFTDTNQHYGIFQLDVFCGKGGGEMNAARTVSAAIAWFRRGSVLARSGFNVQIIKQPYRGPLIKSDPWMMIPVSIPYTALHPIRHSRFSSRSRLLPYGPRFGSFLFREFP